MVDTGKKLTQVIIGLDQFDLVPFVSYEQGHTRQYLEFASEAWGIVPQTNLQILWTKTKETNALVSL